jgi:soluble P-type ATPase
MEKAKAVVFDNSGTLIKRYRAVKNMRTGKICDHVSSIDIVDYNVNRALVVLQTDPSKCIINARPHQTIHDFIKRNKLKTDVSYSSVDIDENKILDIIQEDQSQVADIQDTIKAVMDKHYNVQICSGSGFIMNIDTGIIEFIITAGGKLFKEVPMLIKELKNRRAEIYVASGDRTKSLEQLARFIHISQDNVCGTADSRQKREIVRYLKKNFKVMMVGNSANDLLAIEEADLGVLTLQQEENVPEKLYEAADVIIYNIKDILNIDF